MLRYKETILYAIFVIVITVIVAIKVQPKAVELYNIENDINAKTTEASDMERKLETLKAAAAEKDLALAGSVKKVYKPEFAGMDTESSFTIMFDDIIEMAKYNSVKIYSIEYVYNPASDEIVVGAADKFNICQLNMQVIADYQNIESLLKGLYKYPYLLNFDKIELTPYEKNKAILLGHLQLKLYSSK